MVIFELLPTLIWTCALGLAVGNYATSFIYRMPLGQSPFTKHPYCGGCGTMLEVRDLMPGVSYPLLRGKCRHCHMSIPSTYWWAEIFTAIIFMWGAVTYGWSEAYIMVALGGAVMVTTWGQEVRTGKIFASVLVFLASIGLTYRVLLDGSVYPACYGLIWGGLIPLMIWRMRAAKENPNGKDQPMRIPPVAGLGAVAGMWLAPFGLVLCMLVWALLAVIYRLVAPRVHSWPDKALMPTYSLALMLMILNPQWAEWAQVQILGLLP